MAGQRLGADGVEHEAIVEGLVDESSLVLNDAALFADRAGEQETSKHQDGDEAPVIQVARARMSTCERGTRKRGTRRGSGGAKGKRRRETPAQGISLMENR